MADAAQALAEPRDDRVLQIVLIIAA